MNRVEIPDFNKISFVKAYGHHNFEIKTIQDKTIKIHKFINPKIPKESGIYFLYDKDKNLMYIGQTDDLSQRISTHRLTISPYWIKFLVIKKSYAYRIGIENLLIDLHKPYMNYNLKEMLHIRRCVVETEGRESFI